VGGVVAVLLFFALGVRNVVVYAICMLLVWLAVHRSGVHATVTGVVFGLLTPTKSWIGHGRLGAIAEQTLAHLRGDSPDDTHTRYVILRRMEMAARKTLSPQERFETELHPWSAFVIMPLFALANAGVAIRPSDFSDPVAVAVICGLSAGKPVGIVAAAWMAVRSGIARLPQGVNWRSLIGAGCLAGIGFTMSLFIADLALEGTTLKAAKIGVLAASLVSAILGATLLIHATPASGSAKGSG
jgi:NhaA family Na+:H+ antiporter